MIVSVDYLDSMKNTINVLYGRIILLSLELAELNMEALKQIIFLSRQYNLRHFRAVIFC